MHCSCFQLIDDKRKGIQRSLPPPGGGGGQGRTLGLSKPLQKIEPEKITKPRSCDDDESKASENPE